MTDYGDLLKNIPPKTWVALSKDETRVVGQGGSYGEAVSQAEKAGEEDPILFKTPESDGLQLFFH